MFPASTVDGVRNALPVNAIFSCQGSERRPFSALLTDRANHFIRQLMVIIRLAGSHRAIPLKIRSLQDAASLRNHIPGIIRNCSEKMMCIRRTRRAIATVEHIHALRNWAVAESIDESMNEPHSTTVTDSAITFVIRRASPDGAAAFLDRFIEDELLNVGVNSLMVDHEAMAGRRGPTAPASAGDRLIEHRKLTPSVAIGQGACNTAALQFYQKSDILLTDCQTIGVQ